MTPDDPALQPAPARAGEVLPASELAQALERASWNASMLARTEALCRDAAERFNRRYGDTFVLPQHSIPTAGARVMDLQEPSNKMSKSAASPQGTVLVTDAPEAVLRKFKRAVTDSDGEVRYDPATKTWQKANIPAQYPVLSRGMNDTNGELWIAALFEPQGLMRVDTDTAKKLQAGVDETRRNGNLRGKPAVIVHGRADALLPVSHTSRPYAALNKKVEGAASKLSYVEVANAQHFDSFIGLPTLLGGYDTRYIPLHVYLNRALDAMYAHLRHGAPLPDSQVVRTVPRGGSPGAAPAISAGNVPPILRRPADGDAIRMHGNTLVIPD